MRYLFCVICLSRESGLSQWLSFSGLPRRVRDDHDLPFNSLRLKSFPESFNAAENYTFAQLV